MQAVKYRVVAMWDKTARIRFAGWTWLVCIGRSKRDCGWRLQESLEHISGYDADWISMAWLQGLYVTRPGKWHWRYEPDGEMTDDVVHAIRMNEMAKVGDSSGF